MWQLELMVSLAKLAQPADMHGMQARLPPLQAGFLVWPCGMNVAAVIN